MQTSNSANSDRPASRSWMRKAGAGLALALIAGAGWLAAERWLELGSETAEAAPTAPLPAVTVARPLVQRLVEWDEFTGRFEAVERVEIRARVAGYLDAVHFRDGDLVERGQLLFTIDQRPFRIQVDQAAAAAQAAEAALELRRLDVERAENLRGSPAFQRANYEDRLQNRVQAQAELDRAKAELAAAELDLGFTEVRAPVAGRISDRRVDIGNLVGDATLLTTIVALDPIYFVFDMSEADFLAYQRAVQDENFPSTRDQATVVAVNLVDEVDWHREGRMNFVDNVVDEGSGTVRARGVFPNPDLLIAPGQFGRIRIPGSPIYDAILVPDDAIVTDQARKFVMVVGEDDIAQPRAIRPGPSEMGLRIVRQGLSGQERIIINGLMRVRPGAQVEPSEGSIELPEAFARVAE
jgi:RND family efflux transporter MFP subunit